MSIIKQQGSDAALSKKTLNVCENICNYLKAIARISSLYGFCILTPSPHMFSD